MTSKLAQEIAQEVYRLQATSRGTKAAPTKQGVQKLLAEAKRIEQTLAGWAKSAARGSPEYESVRKPLNVVRELQIYLKNVEY